MTMICQNSLPPLQLAEVVNVETDNPGLTVAVMEAVAGHNPSVTMVKTVVWVTVASHLSLVPYT